MRLPRLLITAALVVTGVAAATPRAHASAPPARGGASLDVQISAEDQPLLGDKSFAFVDNQNPPVTAKRLSKGRYRFTLPGFKTSKGEVNVTTVHDPSDPSNDPICMVSTISVGSSSTKIYVNCFDPVTGKAAPGRRFTLFYSTLQVPNPYDTRRSCTCALAHRRTATHLRTGGAARHADLRSAWSRRASTTSASPRWSGPTTRVSSS